MDDWMFKWMERLVYKWMNEQRNGQIDDRMEEWKDRWGINGCMAAGWVGGCWMVKQMLGQMDKQVDGQMDGQTNGRTDEWINGRTNGWVDA